MKLNPECRRLKCLFQLVCIYETINVVITHRHYDKF